MKGHVDGTYSETIIRISWGMFDTDLPPVFWAFSAIACVLSAALIYGLKTGRMYNGAWFAERKSQPFGYWAATAYLAVIAAACLLVPLSFALRALGIDLYLDPFDMKHFIEWSWRPSASG